MDTETNFYARFGVFLQVECFCLCINYFGICQVVLRIAICFPTSFYHLTTVESSSRGFRGFMDFYDYLQALRRRYLRFWLNQVFYTNPRIMINFIEGDINIFRSQSRLPENFITGIVITLAYILAALLASFYSFQKVGPR